MSAIGQIKVANNLDTASAKSSDNSTGVSNTYDPEGFNPNGIAQWVDRSGGIPVGYPRITMSVRRPSGTNRNYKVSVRLSIPTLEVTAPTTVTGIQPAPTKAYDNSMMLDFVIPERATQAERITLYRQAASLFLTTITAADGAPVDTTGTPLRGAVIDLDQPY